MRLLFVSSSLSVMDPQGDHNVVVDTQCEITCKIMRVRKDGLPQNHTLRCAAVTDVVRYGYPNAQVITARQPFVIDSVKFLNIILIRRNDDDDAVWGDIPALNLCRRNRGLLFINETLVYV